MSRTFFLRGVTVAVSLAAVGGLVVGCDSQPVVPPAHDMIVNSEPKSVTLDPPPTGQGFQLSIPQFDVPPGMEVQDCYFLAMPATESWVKRIEISQNPGTHHMNIFRLGTDFKNGLYGTDGQVVHGGQCWNSANWADWPIVANSQTSDPSAPVNNWSLPAGVGLKFAPGEVVMLQTHYVNATTQKTPLGGRVLVNFYTDAKETFTNGELGSIFATNQSIMICPGDTDKYFETTCKFASAPVTITAANSHFHSRGTDFTMSLYNPASGDSSGPPFYDNTEWDNPVFKTGMNIPVPANGGFKYRCTYTVPSDVCGDSTKNCCFTFGGHVDSQEHCNAFVYYFPKLGAGTTGCY